ncbi:MAG: type IX secretion system sortase PorU [Chitinophagales bacterium]|nr:type IX secretion system sortase PorU [Chitinophagales bacterium]
MKILNSLPVAIRKITTLFSFLLCCTAALAQVVSADKTLNWSDTLQSLEFSDYRLHPAMYFDGASYDDQVYGYLPIYYESVAVPADGLPEVVLTDEVYATAAAGKGMIPADYFKSVGNAPVIKASIGYERKAPYVQMSIVPFRRNQSTGQIERLISFSYHINISGVGTLSGTRGGDSYAEHSFLASGSWYKISVKNDGVFKLDKSFLDALGINTAAIDPRNIRVYGNGGGMLPEPNAAARYDDLQENAIIVKGEEDGRFDAGDYVQFYARGPHRWTYDTVAEKFIHKLNIYSNEAFYFITTDLGAGKRMAEQPSSVLVPNKQISTFDDHAFHEVESENFLESGRDWYGETFEFETSQSFPFSFGNLVTTVPVKVTALVASKSIYSTNSFKLSSSGQTIDVADITKVCSDYTCPFANIAALEGIFNATSGNFDVQLNYTRNAQDAVGWLNYIEVNAQRNLSWSGSQMAFRSIASWSPGSIAQYTVSNTNASLMVLDVTDPVNCHRQAVVSAGNGLQFVVSGDTLHEFVILAEGEGYVPIAVGKIPNQDLHGLPQAAYLIVTPPVLLSYANELADFHRASGMSVNVVTTDQVYNEFSSGAADITAIRDFTRMFYQRAGTDPASMPKYICLFGDGSYDNKGNIAGNQGLIPTFQSANSVSATSSFVSDDFYGLLDNNEGGNVLDPNAKLDIAIGRLPVNDVEQAASVLNKIKIYGSSQSFGNWRNVVTFVADDEDNNTHIKDADEVAVEVAANYPVYNFDKIYFDSYQQISIPGGTRYPDANTAINNRICNGTLLMNYVGHGGVGGWAHERVLQITDIESYTNLYKLTLFVTATCEFSKYDDPAIESAGEMLLSNTKGGAIALVTTVRLVYSSANKLMNQGFMDNVFLPVNGVIPPLGEVFRKGKNSIGGDTNNRKFTLLGDPALTLNYPAYNVVTTAINSHPVQTVSDTIKALQQVTIEGTVNDFSGSTMTSFNGTLYPTVYDKPITYQTLSNDAGSQVRNFVLQKNIIYNGKASVKNGVFTFSFVVPKDISYQYGFGKLSYYAENGAVDAHGYKNDIIIGGVSDTASLDDKGPQVNVYMNDEKFVRGGITDENPSILVKLSDDNGVNTVGTGIGHDIAGTLDNDSKNTLVMNDFYSADLDSYQSGEARYPLNGLSEGPHSIVVKAWDVYNNSSEGSTDFIVSASAELALAHILNYPNPFTTRTEFMFEHNMPGEMLEVMVQVYTISGKLVKTIQQSVLPEMVAFSGAGCSDAGTSGGYRVNNIFWDGKDDYGDPIGKGVYVYKLTVEADNGMKADAFEKLVILK